MHLEVKPCALSQPRGVGWWGRWEGGSRGRGHKVYLWLIHVDVWQKLAQYYKAIILQLKINRQTKKGTFRGLPWRSSGCFHTPTAPGAGSILGQGVKILHATWPKNKWNRNLSSKPNISHTPVSPVARLLPESNPWKHGTSLTWLPLTQGCFPYPPQLWPLASWTLQSSHSYLALSASAESPSVLQFWGQKHIVIWYSASCLRHVVGKVMNNVYLMDGWVDGQEDGQIKEGIYQQTRCMRCPNTLNPAGEQKEQRKKIILFRGSAALEFFRRLGVDLIPLPRI